MICIPEKSASTKMGNHHARVRATATGPQFRMVNVDDQSIMDGRSRGGLRPSFGVP